MSAPDTLAVLDGIPIAQVPAAIARLAGRILAAPAEPADDALLTPDAAAALLQVDRRWVYRNAAALGAVRLSRRKLRVPRAGVQRFMRRAGR